MGLITFETRVSERNSTFFLNINFKTYDKINIFFETIKKVSFSIKI